MSWLGTALKAQGRSQTSLAVYMGLDKGAITRIIQGKRAVKVEEREAIDQYLQATSEPSGLAVANNKEKAKIVRSLHLDQGSLYEKSMGAMIEATLSGDDLELVETSYKIVCDNLINSIANSVPNKDEAGLQRIYVGYWTSPNMDILSGILVCLNAMPVEHLERFTNISKAYDALKSLEAPKPSDFEQFFADAMGDITKEALSNTSLIRNVFSLFILSTCALIVMDFEEGSPTFEDALRRSPRTPPPRDA